ncbi:MAG: ABC transporter permease [Polyangiaceae bacterium]|nr:ABC transporter permease [Polyangiaceae bacterium]
MRGYVVRTLLIKEAKRVGLHRGTVGMVVLLVVTAVLFSVLGPRALEGATTARTCIVDTWDDGPWVRHLRGHVPNPLRQRIVFRGVASGLIRYPSDAVGIQLRPMDEGGYKLWTWHPSGAAEAAAWCEAWLWRETREYFLGLAALDAETRGVLAREVGAIDSRDDAWALREAHARFRERVGPGVVPRFDVERSPFRGGQSPRDAIAMGLTLLALFFVGIFLLPSMTCEERERGTLSAIALSPASAAEIVLGKLAFYFALAFGLAGVVAGIAAPVAFGRPFFWLTLAVAALGSVAVGFFIASLAKTQRGASLGALTYLFATGVLLVTGKGSVIEPVTWLLLERHGPELILAALSGAANRAAWMQLGFASLLVAAWVAAASLAYRRFGWR